MKIIFFNFKILNVWLKKWFAKKNLIDVLIVVFNVRSFSLIAKHILELKLYVCIYEFEMKGDILVESELVADWSSMCIISHFPIKIKLSLIEIFHNEKYIYFNDYLKSNQRVVFRILIYDFYFWKL